MEVDYIRVYKKSSLSVTDNTINPEPKAYPIPVDNQIDLVLNTALNGLVKFEVFDMNGSLVYTKKTNVINGNVQLTDLGTLQKGVYIVTYEKNGLSDTIKFVK